MNAAVAVGGLPASGFHARLQPAEELNPALRMIAEIRGALERLMDQDHARVLTDGFQHPRHSLRWSVRVGTVAWPIHDELRVLHLFEDPGIAARTEQRLKHL